MSGDWLRKLRADIEAGVYGDGGIPVADHKGAELLALAKSAGWLTKEEMEAAGYTLPDGPVAVIDYVPYYAPPREAKS